MNWIDAENYCQSFDAHLPYFFEVVKLVQRYIFGFNQKKHKKLFFLVITTVTIIIDWISPISITMTISIPIARCISVSTTVSSNSVIISSISNATKMTTF
ncbi:hypothetical protein BpHYR1_011556 [Brachionus plicatilis]|uniref:C-type lectin domain-containing protein n=1 Tax=Brachionus plicatilis TaxID=10195 RepID=A0A3M7SRW2_BRAPC|nr:hypothetical protein BpHYR1_011556 [Brachionus plicatilis]